MEESVSEIYRPPTSDVAGPPISGSGSQGSVERALAGDFAFEPFDVLQQAWRLTEGVKGILLVGFLAAVLIAGAMQFVAALLVPVSGVGGVLLLTLLQNLLQMAAAGPIYAGILLVAMRHASGQAVAMNDLFGQFSKAGPIIVVLLLSTVLISVGFVLLVLPGIYLSVAYMMALPLVVDKGMSPWQALETSRKVLTKCWWRMAFTGLLSVLILLVSAIPILIPWIWTIPMALLTVGVIYRNLFGVQTADR
jgi:uncharacterized membrane protein